MDEPESRQRQIIALLAHNGPMTIAELAEVLGLAKTSLRPPLERMVLQGWLDRQRRRQGPGRPADVFSVSPGSQKRFAQETMDEFARLLLEEMVDTEARSKVKSVIAGAGRRLTRLLRPDVGDGPPSERLHRLSEALTKRGILNDISQSRQKATLSIYTCPYAGLSEEYHEICAMHHKIIAGLLGGEACTHRNRREGYPCCQFNVATTSSRSATGRRYRRRSGHVKKTTTQRR